VSDPSIRNSNHAGKSLGVYKTLAQNRDKRRTITRWLGLRRHHLNVSSARLEQGRREACTLRPRKEQQYAESVIQ